MTPPQRKIASITSRLLAWFAAAARDLPWRRTRDPYAIWVSEIMLQQTQVKTVMPYWERWMRRLPTVASLARAKPATVLKLWEGLGYYTRARNLHQAARRIMAEHDGVFPRDFEAMLALPGIGRYTAGAIASIAFNEPRPILDGNVIRVLTRLHGIAGNPRDRAVNQRLWALSGQLVSAATCDGAPARGKLNESLMELGALICAPRSPRCGVCPVRSCCVAWRTNRVERLPNLGKRPPATARRVRAFVVEAGGKFLLRRRPAGVVNAGMWEFPNVDVTGRGSKTSVADTARAALGANAGAGWRKLGVIRHAITRYRIALEVQRARAAQPRPDSKGGRWFAAGQLTRLACPSAHRQIVRLLTTRKSRPGGL